MRVPFPGSAKFSAVFREPAANGRKQSDLWDFIPEWSSKCWRIPRGTFSVSFWFCTCELLCVAAGECFSREAWPSWVPVLHEDWRLQVWSSLQVPSSKRKTNHCSRLCIEPYWSSFASGVFLFHKKFPCLVIYTFAVTLLFSILSTFLFLFCVYVLHHNSIDAKKRRHRNLALHRHMNSLLFRKFRTRTRFGHDDWWVYFRCII